MKGTIMAVFPSSSTFDDTMYRKLMIIVITDYISFIIIQN
jgi:hypothetical protein